MATQSTISNYRHGHDVILTSIAYWLMNGEVDGERISTSKEPSIRDIAEAIPNEWTNETGYVYEQLRDQEVLKTTRCCRRKVDWSPSVEAMRRIQEDLDFDLYVGNERPLQYQKGLHAAIHQAKQHSTVESIIRKPKISNKQLPIDLGVKTIDGPDWLIPVITMADKPDYMVWIWREIDYRNVTKIWIYENRLTMLRSFNAVHNSDLNFEIPGGKFRMSEDGRKNPDNWAAKTVTDKINQATDTRHIAITLTSLIENEALLTQV